MGDARLLVEISGHGFGHLAQTAPVLNRLRRRRPRLDLVVRTTIPRAVLAARIEGSFEVVRATTDPGLEMSSAVHVERAASHAAYRRFHADWSDAVHRDAVEIARLAPDLLLTNVSYRALAAAARLGLPAVTMSSLNWADLYAHYCAGEDGAGTIEAQIRQSYLAAERLLALTPGLPMDGFANRQSIGPVAATGRADPAGVRAALGLAPGTALVWLALGGIPTPLDLARWPALPGVAILTDARGAGERAGFHHPGRAALPFIDLLASCDAVITKPGYGTFTEAVCSGTRVLYTRRPDWPETPYLCAWLERHGVARAIDWNALASGRFSEALIGLLSRAPKSPPRPDGVETASSYLLRRLGFSQ